MGGTCGISASYVPEVKIQQLITEHAGALTRRNAFDSVVGPPGTHRVLVKGQGGEGGDIEFYDVEGNVLLTREVKVQTAGSLKYSTFNKQLKKGVEQAENGEVWYQIRRSSEQEFHNNLRKFLRQPGRRNAPKYRNTQLTAFDENGNIIYLGAVSNAQS